MSSAPKVSLIAYPARIDLGEVASNERVAARFNLLNAGSCSIEFLSVESSCTCTASRLSRTGLDSGESVWLDVVVDAGAKQGQVYSAITVVFREAGSSHSYRQVLGIVGEVRAKNNHAGD